MALVDMTNAVHIDCHNLTNYTTLKNRLDNYVAEPDEVLTVTLEDAVNFVLEYTITVTRSV